MDNLELLGPQELNLPGELRSYQWQGVRFLVEGESALLADEMGLGKTVQVAVALSLLYRKNELGRALVVVPASLRLNWEREIRRWAPTLGVQRVQGDLQDRLAFYRLPISVLVASYDQVRLDVSAINREVRFDVVILDEAQKIKNPASKTALACRTLQRKRSWALSGTPLENNIEELLSVFKYVRSGLLHNGLSRSDMHIRMRPYFLRRLKEQVFEELPSIITQDIPLELTGRQKDAYNLLWSKRLEATSDGQLLALITKLKQLCNQEPHSGESSKLEALRLIVDGLTAAQDKVIVFSQYVATLEWLKGQLRDTIHIDIFHGGLSEAERDDVLRRFREEGGPRLLLMSLGAGATGLNLQEANMVVFYDRWWNPAVENQALHRAYRFGRTKPLHVIRFLVIGTIEERIETVLREKGELFELYINSAESAPLNPFTRNELKRILSLDEV